LVGEMDKVVVVIGRISGKRGAFSKDVVKAKSFPHPSYAPVLYLFKLELIAEICKMDSPLIVRFTPVKRPLKRGESNGILQYVEKL